MGISKLVRDHSIQSHDPSSDILQLETVKGQKYVQALHQRICDGADRYKSAPNDRDAVQELVDLLELIHTALPLHNMTFEELDMVRRRKKAEQGSFVKGVLVLDPQAE